VSDFEDRLAALDPAAGQPYQHRDLDLLISRITSVTTPAKSRVWRNFQLKVASTLVASALVTTGAIAALQGSSGLPVLALQSTSGAASTPRAPSDFGPGASSAMEIYAKFDFSVGPGLSSTTPTSDSYQLFIPSSASSEGSRIAAIFGITGAPVNSSDNSTDWTVTNASGSSLNYANSGVPEWSYSTNESSNSSLNELPSRVALENDVQSYLGKLGFGYSVSTPVFGTTTTTNNNSTPSSSSTEDVTYSVDVDNVSTDQYVNFSVDAANQVVSASGPAFSVASTLNYPLQSFTSAVSALNAAQQSKYPSASPIPNTSTGGVNSGSSTTTSTPPSGPPIVDVTLNSASLTLAAYQLTDGSMWLLPVYSFAGVETSANGTISSGNWYELALDPSYVQYGASVTRRGVVNY
jgi:hypothetical protein